MRVLPLSFALLGAALSWQPARADAEEPTHGGRTLSEWLGDLTTGPVSKAPGAIFEQPRDAYDALHEIGPAAIAPLIDATRSPSMIVRYNAAEVLAIFGPEARPAVGGLIALLDDDSAEIRATAAEALGNIGPEAREAIPALVLALEDSEPHGGGAGFWRVSRFARGALVKIGPESAPALREALTHDDAVVRSAACHALGELPAAGQASAPGLIAALSATESFVRATAAESLGRLQVKEAVPSLIDLLADDGTYGFGHLGTGTVRYHAAKSLKQIGVAPDDVPGLVKLLEEDTAEVRVEAARLLGSLGAEAEEAMPALRKLCGDDPMRYAAAAALLQIAPRHSIAQRTIAEALEDEDEWKRRRAAVDVGKLGRIPPGLHRDLIRATFDRSGNVRMAAAGARLRADPNDGPALAAFVRELGNIDNYLWQGAIAFDQWEHVLGVLRSLGPNAKAAVPTLVEVFKKSNWDRARLAPEALAVIGPHAAAAVPTLVEALEHPELNMWVKEKVYEALGAIGPAAKAALPLLEDDFAEGYLHAAEPMARIGGEGVVALCDALAEGTLKTRVAAARALALSGDSHDEAAEALGRALADPRVDVRVEAAESLGRLGPAARHARQALEGASQDEYLVVRRAALGTLETMRP